MSILSTITYSRDVLLSIGTKVVKQQYLPAEILQDAAEKLPLSCLRVFRYSALTKRNRKVFSNLSLKSSRVRQFIFACKHRHFQRLQRLSPPAGVPRSARQAGKLNAGAPVLASSCPPRSHGLLPHPKPLYVPEKSFHGILPLPTPGPLPLPTPGPLRLLTPGLLPLPTPGLLSLSLLPLPKPRNIPAKSSSVFATFFPLPSALARNGYARLSTPVVAPHQNRLSDSVTSNPFSGNSQCIKLVPQTSQNRIVAAHQTRLSDCVRPQSDGMSSTLPNMHRTSKRSSKIHRVKFSSPTRVSSTSSLKFTLFNVRSLKLKSLLVRENIEEEGIDCLMLIETWLTQCSDACITECCPSEISLLHTN